MTNLMCWVKVLLCVVPVIYASKHITGEVACNNTMVLFINGVQFKKDNINKFKKPVSISIPDDKQLIAIKCTHTDGPFGIKMILSNGFETSAAWKCKNKYHEGWNEPGFNDATWLNAVVIYHEWIWTPKTKNTEDTTVYCRKAIGDRTAPKHITGTVTCHNIMVLYINGVQFKKDNISNFEKPVSISIPDDKQLIAIKCTYTGGPIGIQMIMSNGFETSAAWKCKNTHQQGWNELGFNDGTWSYAVVIKNELIWTADTIKDKTVYCRKVIGDRTEMETDNSESLSCSKVAAIAAGAVFIVTLCANLIGWVILKTLERQLSRRVWIMLLVIIFLSALAIGVATYYMCENYLDHGTVIGADAALALVQLIIEFLICLFAFIPDNRSNTPSPEASAPSVCDNPPPYKPRSY